MAPPDLPFTGFGSNAPDSSVINSISSAMASLDSQFSSTAAETAAATTSAEASSLPAQPTSTSAAPITESTTSMPSATTLSTVPSSTVSSSDVTTHPSAVLTTTSSTTPGSRTTTSVAPNAASSSSSGSISEQSSCHSISCSPGLQAAIAVPVVVGVLLLLALGFLCLRRRKRQDTREKPAVGAGAAVGATKPRKKWTRHLRMFSFDAELLMSGRFSSTNSLRSGQSSVRANAQTPRSGHTANQDSVHSIESVAPPYRDALNHATPDMTHTGPGLLAAGAIGEHTVRPSSSATAPPPYGAPSTRQTNRPPTDAASRQNPFSDVSPTSPADGSPFNDPRDDDSLVSPPATSRGSSIHHESDEGSVFGGSDTASIHEARVGRHISVGSMGRTIETQLNTRNSSSSS